MQCRDAQEALIAVIDGEAALGLQRAASAHVATCPTCMERAGEYRRTGDQLRALGRVSTPPRLEGKIRARLAAERRPANDNESFAWRRFAQQAAVLAVVAGLSGVGGWQLSEQAAQKQSLARDVVTAHARALLQDSAVHIASSESDTVKTCFNGRLEFTPNVKDLTAEGFPLVGGRLDLIRGHRAATLVYKRRQHVITVFIWPAAS